MLSKEHILEQLHTRWAGCNIIYKDVTGSTNTDAKELSANGAPHGTLVVADRQDKGRGTRGRKWENPSGCNIAMSLILKPEISANDLSMLTLVMGLSVAEGIERAVRETEEAISVKASNTANNKEVVMAEAADRAPVINGENEVATAEVLCHIKWPNDVVIKGRKICGILTELHMNPDGKVRDVVIGVGINVNTVSFPEEIIDIAGSLFTMNGHRVDRSLVVARCMESFESNYGRYVESCSLELLKDQYELRLLNKGERVRILDPKGEYEGTALGITKRGALLVEREGAVIEINAGEVSVRGLYSYA